MSQFALYRMLLATDGWQDVSENLPPEQADWLGCQGSLTQKLQQHCQHLSVRVCYQGWQQAVNFVEETPVCWLREVLLLGDEQPWIFAQTRLSQAAIESVAASVPSLGERPIGLWLFEQNPKRLNLQWKYDQQTGLYARCSLLDVQGYSIEIKELFLSAFRFVS